MMRESNMDALLGELRLSDANYSYRFYLKVNEAGVGNDVISGELREKNPLYLRIRLSEGYREHQDIILLTANILYIKEDYSGE